MQDPQILNFNLANLETHTFWVFWQAHRAYGLCLTKKLHNGFEAPQFGFIFKKQNSQLLFSKPGNWPLFWILTCLGAVSTQKVAQNQKLMFYKTLVELSGVARAVFKNTHTTPQWNWAYENLIGALKWGPGPTATATAHSPIGIVWAELNKTKFENAPRHFRSGTSPRSPAASPLQVLLPGPICLKLGWKLADGLPT